MVTIITEKLRNQKLDDIQFEPIPQCTRRSWELCPTTGASTTSTGRREWAQCVQGSGEFWRTRHASMPQCLGETAHTGEDGVGGAHSPHPHLSLETPPLCSHHRNMATCALCEALPSTPPAPPKKRHCRSLSIPGDAPAGHPAWQPQASSIWRPVAVRPRLGKSRNSPLVLHKAKASAGSPLTSLGGQGASQRATSHSPGAPACTVVPPRAWSSLSDHFTTPPETPSPVPRPASASSGFCDSSQGSLYTPWSDSSTSPSQPPPSHPPSSSSTPPTDLFKLRSLSMEEPISGPVSPAAGTTAASTPAAATTVSMPSLPHHHVRSTPSSPRRHRVPRCRSQPSVLYDRKAGMKRRREDARPTLDLFKMKETALERSYEARPSRSHSFTCSGGGGTGAPSTKPHRNVQFAPIQQDSGPVAVKSGSRALVSLFTEPPECFLGLNTIASSPLDTATLPPPHSDTLPKPRVLTPALATAAAAAPPPAAAAALAEERHQGRCKTAGRNSSRAELLSDSGCSDTNEDSVDLAGFIDSENSCHGDEGGAMPPQEEEQEQFDLEINNDLDLEQIEKD